MKRICTFIGVTLATVSCAVPSENRPELEGVKRISIEFLHANTKALIGMTVEIHGYVRAGYDGSGFSCEIRKSKTSSKMNTRAFLNSPICVVPNRQEYKEGMATVRGIVISRYSDDSGEPDATDEFYVFNRIYSRELKDVTIKWDK